MANRPDTPDPIEENNVAPTSGEPKIKLFDSFAAMFYHDNSEIICKGLDELKMVQIFGEKLGDPQKFASQNDVVQVNIWVYDKEDNVVEEKETDDKETDDKETDDKEAQEKEAKEKENEEIVNKGENNNVEEDDDSEYEDVDDDYEDSYDDDDDDEPEKKDTQENSLDDVD